MFKEQKLCRVCEGKLVDIINLGSQALTGIFHHKSDPTLHPHGPLELRKCIGECGLVQLGHNYEPDFLYGDNYGYRSGLNDSMVQHLRSLFRYSLNTLHSAPRTVLDIGFNDGTFLRNFPSSVAKYGIDPSAKKFSEFHSNDITVAFELFSCEKYLQISSGVQADLITSFSMFYDLPDPIDFVTDIKKCLSRDGVWLMEQSYLLSMLNAMSFDTICHEHIEYYDINSIEYIIDKAGMKIIDIWMNDINGGSFGLALTHAENETYQVTTRATNFKLREKSVDVMKILSGFEPAIRERKDECIDYLKNLHNENIKIAALGASTKGNVLLQYWPELSHYIERIGEVNTFKFDKYTPGTGILIENEDELLLEYNHLVVLPWHFKENFISNPKYKGKILIFPLPQLEVIKVE